MAESDPCDTWQRVTTLASGIAEALGTTLSIAAVYDRDYFCQEQIDEVRAALSEHLRLAYVHKCKEIENYLLIRGLLDRAVGRILAKRAARSGLPIIRSPKAAELLLRITDPMRDSVLSQIMARRWDHFRSSGRDLAEINRGTIAWFSQRWNDLMERLKIVPGKEVVREYRNQLQENLGVSLTDARIVENFRREEIPNDLKELLEAINRFRASTPE